jgi:small GTP-binding protein
MTARRNVSLLVMGAPRTGKTCLVAHLPILFEERAIHQSIIRLNHDNEEVLLRIVDMVDQPRWWADVRLRNAQGIAITCDSTDSSAIQHTSEELARVAREKQSNVPILIVATKCDIAHASILRELHEFAAQRSLTVIETSATTHVGVNEAFHSLAVRVLAQRPKPMTTLAQKGLCRSWCARFIRWLSWW